MLVVCAWWLVGVGAAGAGPAAAIREIPAGAVVTAADLGRASRDAVVPADAWSAEQAIGRTALRRVDAGAVLRAAWFAVDPPAAGTVVRGGQAASRAAPSGKARVTPLLAGPEAFVGLLALDAGAAIPEHRDPTGEYVWFVEGSGTLVIDGLFYEVGPGSAAYMPANALVSFAAGPDPVRVVQVFAGPESAAKYATWAEGPTPGDVARTGPFEVACDAGACAIRYRGTALVDELWSYRAAADVLAEVGSPLGFEGVWLAEEHAGDGCPAMYRPVCVGERGASVGASFGNCEAPTGLRVEGAALAVDFPSRREIGRKARVARIDPETCAVTP